MPDKISHLPQDLVNQIAAGEVVERPASVLKELIENSIDADSTHIVIRIEKGGTKLISVADNGTGMSSRDAIFAFDRHATSKLSSKDDLFNLHTLGFRGEALASIAAVSRIKFKTRERETPTGTYVEIEGGSIGKNIEYGCPPGTEIEVMDIFYNVPARKSFLKSVTTELGHMLNIVTHQALAHKGIHFILIDGDKGNKTILDLPPVESFDDRIFQIYGGSVLSELTHIHCNNESGDIHGMVSRPTLAYKSKENQLFFVNKRSIRNPGLSHAIQEAYSDLIPKDRYPMVLLFIDLDPRLVDVNVHPTKREVRFRDGKYIHDMVVEAIRNALQTRDCENPPSPFPSPLRGEGWGEGATNGFAGRPIIVSEGFNPFIDNTDIHVQELPTKPLIRVLGQIGALFIVAEIDGDLNVIDQHAAHERVIYDKLKKGFTTRAVDSQILLIPDTIELPLDKAHTLCEYKEFLYTIGFDIEEIGDRSFMLRSIPIVFAGEDSKSLLINMIDEIMERDLSPAKDLKLTVTEEVIKALLSRRACHSAVRAKGLLSDGEMSALVSDLLQTDMPYTCPHGRPIVKKFSHYELERMFGRK